MKNTFLAALAVLAAFSCSAQKFYTKSGKINFDATSSSSPERVEAVNRTVTCVIDTRSGAIQFVALIKGFEFERALMEEHFNENYMESEKYPKAEFRGEIKNNGDIDYTRDGTYPAKVKGKLTMHGESDDIDAEARFIIQNGKISALADFSVKLSDFKISIPGLVADKVSKTAKISVACSLEPLKN